MTVYAKSMMESLAEVRGLVVEDNVDLMRKAASGSMQTIKMKDGKLKMDSFTASAIMQIYDKVNPANQKKMTVMINKGTKAGMLKLQSFAMKQVKSGYGEEVELDEWTVSDVELAMKKKYGKVDKEAIEKLKKVQYKGNVDRNDLVKVGHGKLHVEEVELDEGGRPSTEKTVTVVHKTSGKELLVTIDSVKKYEKMGYKVVKEETELDEEVSEKDFDSLKKGDTVTIEYKSAMSSGTATFNVTAKNVVGKAKVGKVTLQSTKNPRGVKHFLYKRGNKVSFAQGDMGASVVSFKKEEVELDEAKYDLYHKDFSTAMQYAYKMSKKMYGITIDDKEIDDKVATGPRKPSEGKTNKYRLKGDKGAVQIQVYNKGGSKPFELNMYKEEVELYEGKMKELHGYIKQGKDAEWIAKKMKLDVKTIKALIGQDDSGRFMAGSYKNEAWEIGTDEYREYLEKLTPGESTVLGVDEASARADAMKAMRGGREVDPADVDMDASDADVKAASKNILMQMRKASNLGGKFEVEFLDKKKVKVKPAIANAFIRKYERMRKPADKERLQNQAMKSYKDMLKVLKDGYNEEVVNEGYIELEFKDKSSAERAYNYINNKIWAGGNPPYEDFNQEGNSLQIDTDDNLNRRNRMLKDLKDLPRNLSFKVVVNEGNELDEGREKGMRQLINPNKEVMVVKKNKVIVIDKKDQDKYLKQGWDLAEEVVKEGTWALPKTPQQKKELKKLLSKPLKAKDATEKLYDVIGDDTLFDDIGDFAETEPNADVRSMVRTAMKRLGIKEETILDRIAIKLKERKNG